MRCKLVAVKRPTATQAGLIPRKSVFSMLPHGQSTIFLTDMRTPMNDDKRCCGTGTCLINADGLCWCGQQWNGSTMCSPETVDPTAPPLLDEDTDHRDTP